MADEILRTGDEVLIKWVLAQGDIYECFRDDDDPELKDLQITISPRNYWFLFLRDGNIAGMCRCDKVYAGLYSCHMAVLEEYRKTDTHVFGEMCREYMKDNTDAIKFIGMSNSERALKWAVRAGFRPVAVLKNAYLKNGKPTDLYLSERE